ncbi:DUF5343 domain-containing protein [Bosea sp. LjRoot237]|uniref:DUF5343 domain-containing protein n=1 Tax=Bosea sp. LjRoot237 TaxID=3342292 RepID=UPI003ECD18A6
MSDKPKVISPPYATFGSFLGFLNKLRDTVVPGRIDPSVFGNASGSISYSVIAALKFLKLIDDAGIPSERFTSLVESSDDERKSLLREVITQGYPSLFKDSVNLRTITAGQFDEHIRNEFDVQGSTVDKIAAFFISGAKMAEITLSQHLLARKTVSASSNNKKAAKHKRRDETHPPNEHAATQNTNNSSPAAPPMKYHPFVQGLLDEIPETEKFSEWSVEDQAEWLRAAAGIFKLLSKSKGRITISITENDGGS